MPRYGHDASHYDWGRGALNLAAEHAAGIDLFTYKATEGTSYVDEVLSSTMIEARPVGFPVLGTYHFLWPGNAAAQADFWLAAVEEFASWWRDHPCWIWQIDAETTSAGSHPTVADINACGDRIVARTGCSPKRVAVYAPHWLYGGKPRGLRSDLPAPAATGGRGAVLDASYHEPTGTWRVPAAEAALAASGGLAGLRYQLLWASSYVGGSGDFKTLYPGDGASQWGAYDGITPTILQYTSSATIAGQHTCDANAIRVNSVADLQALFEGDNVTSPSQWSAADWAAFDAHAGSAANHAALAIEAQVAGNLSGTINRIVSDLSLDQAADSKLNTLTAKLGDLVGQVTAVQTTVGKLQTGQVDVQGLADDLMAGGLPLELAQQIAAHVTLAAK
ncbi:MAG TPA: GH25 family lysozyme [Jatrophihabitantaceae bacterium]|jgi:hypothetical protein